LSTNHYDDDNGHGTHVAGSLLKNNLANGIAQMWVICSVRTNGTTTNIAAGVEWAIQQKVDIINLSLTTN
jgi:subtilisin